MRPPSTGLRTGFDRLWTHGNHHGRGLCESRSRDDVVAEADRGIAWDDGFGMNASQAYKLGGADLLHGLLSPEVATAMAHQIAVGVARGGTRWLVPPSIGNKPCYEVSCMEWPVLLTFLWGMTPGIEGVVGARLLPTYSY